MDWKSAALIWAAWIELNKIRARDGVPRMYDGTHSSVSEEYFSALVDALADQLGDWAVPWPQEGMKPFLPTAYVKETEE